MTAKRVIISPPLICKELNMCLWICWPNNKHSLFRWIRYLWSEKNQCMIFESVLLLGIWMCSRINYKKYIKTQKWPSISLLCNCNEDLHRAGSVSVVFNISCKLHHNTMQQQETCKRGAFKRTIYQTYSFH